MVFPTGQFLVRLFSIGFTVITVVDDNIPYNGNKTNDLVIKSIEHFSEVLFQWFVFTYMKTNRGISHTLLSRNNNVNALIDDTTTMSEKKN